MLFPVHHLFIKRLSSIRQSFNGWPALRSLEFSTSPIFRNGLSTKLSISSNHPGAFYVGKAEAPLALSTQTNDAL